MKTVSLMTALGALTLLATAPVQAQLSRQSDKNLNRNGAYALGALAVNKLLQGRPGEALALGAGAAYAGKKYEDSRKAQRDESEWGRYGRDDYRDNYRRNERYDRDRDDRWERDEPRYRNRRDEDDCRDDRRGHEPRGKAWGWHRKHDRH